MKTIYPFKSAFLVATIFLLNNLFFKPQLKAQTSPLTINISGPETVEIGIEYTYSIVINKSTASNFRNINLTSIECRVSWNAGTSVIVGKMNGMPTSSATITSFTSTSSGNTLSTDLKIIWGDLSTSDKDELVVTCAGGFEEANASGTAWVYKPFLATRESIKKEILTKRVCPPSLVPNKSAYACCTGNITYSAYGYCTANTFNWTASNGASIVAGQGTANVQIMPPVNGAYMVSLEVGRNSASTLYKRIQNLVVTRPAPGAVTLTPIGEPNPGGGVNVLCTGKSYAIQVQGGVCGLSNMTWSAPGCAISAQGGNTTTITPLSSTSNNTPVQVQFTASYTGGCTPVAVSANYLIRRADAVNTPSGTLGGYTPSNSTLMNQLRTLSFNSINVNGSSIFISPATLALWNYYYYNGTQLRNYNYHTTSFVSEAIQVFQTNGCASKSRDYTYTVPKPLLVPGFIPTPMFKNGAEFVLNPGMKMKANPNPGKEQMEVSFNQKVSGTLALYDYAGKRCFSWELIEMDGFNLPIVPEQIPGGLYVLQFANGTEKLHLPIAIQP